MISKCFAMIFQWVLCPSNSIPVNYLHKSKGTFVSQLQDSQSRYFEKCFFKLTRCQSCIVLLSNYTRNKGFPFASSSKKASNFPGCWVPLCPGRCFLARRRPSVCIQKQLQNQLPGITVVRSHKTAGHNYFKLSEKQKKQMEIILTLPLWSDLRLNQILVWKPPKKECLLALSGCLRECIYLLFAMLLFTYSNGWLSYSHEGSV